MLKWLKIAAYILLGLMGFMLLVLLLANFGLFGKMPSMSEIRRPSKAVATQVLAADGSLLGKFYIQDRLEVKYDEIGKNVEHALLATEDERFYYHPGIDVKSAARAVFTMGREGGGSTLTMQTAKNLFTDHWETHNFFTRLVQKIKESIIAIKLEISMTKKEILTLYLNTVSFSDNIYGIKNASLTFFQKNPDSLGPGEAAVLIGMLKGATLYNPRRNPKLSLLRRNTVLGQMEKNNYLTPGQAEALKAEPIVLNYRKLDEKAGLAPYLRMVIGEHLKAWSRDKGYFAGDNYDIYKDGFKIYTTIDPTLQRYAEQAVDEQMSRMQKQLDAQSDIRSGKVWEGHEDVLEAAMKNSDRWQNLSKQGLPADRVKKTFFVPTPMRVFAWNVQKAKDTVMTPFDSIKYHRQMLQCSFVVLDPHTGEVKAWVGGIDFKTYKLDHVAGTQRQVGSTIKPLLYSMAIDDYGFSPATWVRDQQQDFGHGALVPATSASCTGASMTMADALAHSRNCATAFIMKRIAGNGDATKFVEFLHHCGITSNLVPVPSLAIGTCEVSLIEMVQAYTMFPGMGTIVKPFYIRQVEDNMGHIVENYETERKRGIGKKAAYEVVTMMEGVLTHGTGQRIWTYGVKAPLAGKTGTTNENSDAWFIGYSTGILGGVWTGCDDRFIKLNSKAGEGASMALPVWALFYKKFQADGTISKKRFSTSFEALKNEAE